MNKGLVFELKNYFKHLLRNWYVALHALRDFGAHIVHGMLPFIQIRHHQPVRRKNNV